MKNYLQVFKREKMIKELISFIALMLLITSTAFSQTKPGSSNTGPSGTLTTYSGSSTITVDGTVLEDYVINSTIRVQANNVTIRNCRIQTSGYYGIQCTYGNTGLLIEDCEIKNMQSAAVYGSNFTARRCNIWNSGADAFKPFNNFVIESCWMHHLGFISDSHADGLQMVSGSNGIVRWNNFDMKHDEPGYNNSQCIIIQTNIGTIDNVLIDENWINGGGYSVQVRDKGTGYGPPTNIVVTNNLFGRDYQFGTHIIEGNNVFDCNAWEDTGVYIGGCTGGVPTVVTPVINPAGGAISNPVTVSITCATSGAEIRYTLDGSNPTESSTLYAGSFEVNSSITVKARGYKTDMNASPVASAAFSYTTGSNVALGKTVTQSAYQNDPPNVFPGSNLTDGNTSDDSRWSVSGFPQWAEIDLGNNYDLSSINVYTYQGRAYQYIVEAKVAGGSYSTIVDRSSNASGAQPIADNVSTTARYVKITVSGASGYTGSWVSITELEAFGELATGTIPVTGVSVSPTSLNLEEGQTSDLTETVSPSNATDKLVTWNSNNTSVATVNASGLVTAVSAGNATITVTTNDGGFTDNCIVTVTASGSYLIDEDFSAGASNFSEIAGGAWSVSGGRYVLSGTGDASVGLLGNISVNNANVTGDFALSTLINITGTTSAWDDAAVVFDYQDVNNYCYVSLNESNDGNTKGIFKVVNGSSSELADITTSISDDTDYTLEIIKTGSSIVAKLNGNQVASATDGTFTGGKVGYGSKNDAAQFDNLQVSASGSTVPVTGVSVSPTSLALTEGQTSDLTETVSPVDATDKSVNWSSSNSSIATVDANGLVTAVAAGNATITVTTVDGGFTANCSVSVTPAIIYVTSVSVSPTSLSLDVSQTADLTETVSPSNATDKSVSWSSSNSSIATVNASGLVTAVAEGSATITVTTTDGSFTANCAVTVSAPTQTWTELTYDDFESGWGNFSDGGGDCNLYAGGTYAHQGSNAGQIQDNSGNYSTFYYTNSVDLSSYAQLKIEFWFYGLGMDDGHEFLVEYSDNGGSSWQTIATYAQGAGNDFVNGQFYEVSGDDVQIDNGAYNFSSNAKIRFRCNAYQNDDQVYIDEVKVSATTSGSSSANVTLAENTSNASTNIYPNPLHAGMLNIAVNGYNEAVNVVIYDLTGRSVYAQQYFNQTEVQIPASNFNNGIYIVSVNGKQQKLVVEQ